MSTCRFTRSDYDKFPATETQGPIWRGWTEICSEIARRTSGENALLVFDTYHGVYDAELTEAVGKIWPEAEWITTESLFHDEAYLRALTEPYVTDDELFGYLSPLGIADYFDPALLRAARERQTRRAASSESARDRAERNGASVEKLNLMRVFPRGGNGWKI